MSALLPNPRGSANEHWFKPAQYPTGVLVCPLCHLPETSGVYSVECHCWDEHCHECGHPPGGHVPGCVIGFGFS